MLQLHRDLCQACTLSFNPHRHKFLNRFSAHLLPPDLYAAPSDQDRRTGHAGKENAFLIYLLTLGSPGLIVVDHIHFQYNGFLLGATASLSDQ